MNVIKSIKLSSWSNTPSSFPFSTWVDMKLKYAKAKLYKEFRKSCLKPCFDNNFWKSKNIFCCDKSVSHNNPYNFTNWAHFLRVCEKDLYETETVKSLIGYTLKRRIYFPRDINNYYLTSIIKPSFYYPSCLAVGKIWSSRSGNFASRVLLKNPRLLNFADRHRLERLRHRISRSRRLDACRGGCICHTRQPSIQ